MPTPRQIEQFAEFFDISKEEAKHQFEVCCEEYNKKKGRPEPQEQNYAEGPEAEKKAATEQLQALVPNTKSALPQNLRTDLMESLYGKVPFNEWLQIANNGVNYESLKNLYGQIDIETYTRLLREIKDRPKYEFDFRQIYGKIDREVFEMLYDNIQDRKERPLNELKHENNDR